MQIAFSRSKISFVMYSWVEQTSSVIGAAGRRKKWDESWWKLLESQRQADGRGEKMEWRYSRHASSLPNEKGIIPMKCVKPVNYSRLHELR